MRPKVAGTASMRAEAVKAEIVVHAAQALHVAGKRVACSAAIDRASCAASVRIRPPRGCTATTASIVEASALSITRGTRTMAVHAMATQRTARGRAVTSASVIASAPQKTTSNLDGSATRQALTRATVAAVTLRMQLRSRKQPRLAAGLPFAAILPGADPSALFGSSAPSMMGAGQFAAPGSVMAVLAQLMHGSQTSMRNASQFVRSRSPARDRRSYDQR